MENKSKQILKKKVSNRFTAPGDSKAKTIDERVSELENEGLLVREIEDSDYFEEQKAYLGSGFWCYKDGIEVSTAERINDFDKYLIISDQGIANGFAYEYYVHRNLYK